MEETTPRSPQPPELLDPSSFSPVRFPRGNTRHRLFRDIDVAVYTAGKISYHDEPYYTYTLSLLLSKPTGVPVDVRLTAACLLVSASYLAAGGRLYVS